MATVSLVLFPATNKLRRDRFHEEIKQTLERRRADVVELSQALTEMMSDIHDALVQCINSTLAELRRSRADVSMFSSHDRTFDQSKDH